MPLSEISQMVQDVADRLVSDVQAAWGGKTHWGSVDILQETLPYNVIELESIRTFDDASTVSRQGYVLAWSVSRVEKELARQNPEKRKVELLGLFYDKVIVGEEFAGAVLRRVTQADFAADNSTDESILALRITFECVVVPSALV
jgi:hypothetical protein